MWQKVLTTYLGVAVDNNWPMRDMDSLRNKFKSLKNSRKPTGDPNCPIDVKRAKSIQRLIDNSSDTVGFDDDEEEEEENDDSDEEAQDDEDDAEDEEEDIEDEGQDGRAEEEEAVVGEATPSTTASSKATRTLFFSSAEKKVTPPATKSSTSTANPSKRVGGLSKEQLVNLSKKSKLESHDCESMAHL